jgi:hypothetical protein
VSLKSSLDALGDSDIRRLKLILIESFYSIGRLGILLGSKLNFYNA